LKLFSIEFKENLVSYTADNFSCVQASCHWWTIPTFSIYFYCYILSPLSKCLTSHAVQSSRVCITVTYLVKS